METLNYKELKKEFKRKQQAEKKVRISVQTTSVEVTQTRDDKLHNLKTKQEYWQYLLEQKSA